MANHHDPDRNVENEAVHHEESDVNIRAIFGFALGLLIVAVVVHVAIYVLFRVFTSRADAASATRVYPLSVEQENRLPPEPRLQVNPKQDLRDLRAEEDAQLNGYHWVDRNNNVVRIPIDEAMKLTLQRGLPSRSTTTPQPAAGQVPRSTPQPAAGQAPRPAATPQPGASQRPVAPTQPSRQRSPGAVRDSSGGQPRRR